MKGFGENNKVNRKRQKHNLGSINISQSKINQKSHMSQNKIQSKACQLHSKVDLDGTAKYYKLFVERGYIVPKVLNNNGVIRKQKVHL